MRTLRFSNLYLISQHEKRAFKMPFHERPTVIRAGNGFGKSAIMKSLYDTFGAQPHKIDSSWRGAQVISIVDFEVDKTPYTAMKALGSYVIFDSDRRPLIRTTRVTEELGPFLADLLGFRLLMVDQREKTITPPPAYIFAPFYIDQDKSWNAPWASFDRMYLPRTKFTLAEYHSGLKSNAYYEAIAERDHLKLELKNIDAEHKALQNTLERLRLSEPEIILNYDLDDFKNEAQMLIARSQHLQNEQRIYRKMLSTLNYERELWCEQRDLLRNALREMDIELHDAVEHSSVVECPTCGYRYENSIVEQFSLIEDTGEIAASLMNANMKITQLETEIQSKRAKVGEFEALISNIWHALDSYKKELSFRDIVFAEGRNEAIRVMKEQISDEDRKLGEKLHLIERAESRMNAAQSRSRSMEIMSFFREKLRIFAQALDVRLDDPSKQKIYFANQARGSERPRGLIAYYYAFLHTAQRFGSSADCPILIDAPNQQGQDEEHLPAIMKFIFENRPSRSQLIVASEELFGVDTSELDVFDIGTEKHRLLREDLYSEVSKDMGPYLSQML